MSIADVPESIKSSVFGLGNVVEVFPVKKSSRVGSIAGMIVLLGGASIAMVYALLITYSRWQTYGPAILPKTFFPPFIISMVFLILGIVVSWSFFNNKKKIAVIYDEGIVYQDRKGLKSWRWSEIASLTSAVTKNYTNGIYTGTTHFYTVVKKGGEKFVLNDVFADVERLAGIIRENIFPLLYKLYANAYNDGKTLSFGPVKISKAGGIQIGKKVYHWETIAEVGIKKGVVSVKKKEGGWFSGATATTSTIPNIDILLSIVDQILGIKI